MSKERLHVLIFKGKVRELAVIEHRFVDGIGTIKNFQTIGDTILICIRVMSEVFMRMSMHFSAS